jgi:hypothetical protein
MGQTLIMREVDRAMDLRDFTFVPLPAIPEPPVRATFLGAESPLGPLSDLPGTWTGTGFNTIWRPFYDDHGGLHNPRFLELNLTDETLQFNAIGGNIPNRGLFQHDIFMYGITYLQQINDHNLSTPGNPVGLHMEPGLWAVVPFTTDPPVPPTVVRMGSIPHGTTIHAQGVTEPAASAGPLIREIDINPLALNGEKQFPFPEQDLSKPTRFRSSGDQVKNITQSMVNNPNSVLTAAISGQTIVETTTLKISTNPHQPVLGGGTANTAFLQGSPAPNHIRANADATEMTATFWIEKVQGNGEPDFLQLQYSQTVLLQFGIFVWPHVTVATLRKQAHGS